jgi:crotonobetainyl-CoA:carnitine CoA-transferase CaiB-like acyl-CoA transferase
LAKTSDVFLTNYLPAQRQKNKFDVEHIRAVNPKIVYAHGTAYGDKGVERDVGGYAGTAFWTRSGIGYALTPQQLGGALPQGIRPSVTLSGERTSPVEYRPHCYIANGPVKHSKSTCHC